MNTPLIFSLILMTWSTTIFLACSTSSLEKRIDQEIIQAPTIHSAEELQMETSQLIETAPHINREQKKQLSTLQKMVRNQITELNEDSLRLRSKLIKTVLDPKDPLRTNELAILKHKMRENENKRLALIFESIDQANKILGKDAPKNTQMIRELFSEPWRHFE